MKRARRCLLAAAAIFALTGAAIAQSAGPDATVTFSGGSVAAGVGYTWGDGVLHLAGRDYPFTVKGLSVVDVGASRIEGSGEVYNLSKLADFSGNYVAAGVGATLAGGGSVAALENEHGVIIHFRSTTQGLQLTASGNGIYIALKQ